MSTSPVVIDTFGGLDLADDPEEVGFGNAVDLVNVGLHNSGRLTTRPGTASITSDFASATSTTRRPFVAAGNTLLVNQDDTQAKAYTTAGGAALASFPRGVVTGYVNIGTPSTSVTYFGTESGSLCKWDGAAFSTVGVISAFWVTASPIDNRLVTAGSGPSNIRIKFSDAGAPETFAAANYVDLDPGDGEYISGLVTWRDQIFAFKQSKFFVFYGTSTASTGTPVFNFRSVRVGVGAQSLVTTGYVPAGTSLVAANDGVYFVATDGIYRTTGDVPVKVSGAIDPWFRGDTLPLAQSLAGRTATGIDMDLSTDGGNVYLRTGSKTFVFNTLTQQWFLYGFPVYGAAVNHVTGRTYLGVPGKIVYIDPALTTDDGTAISWSYRSGASDLGSPQQKVVWAAKAWGSGTPTVSVYADHATTDAGAAAVTLGTAPAVTQGVQSFSRKGTFFSVGLSGTGPVTVHRAEIDVRDVRVAGTS